MSGHSHWATIKHKKGIADAKKGQVFSKLGKEITIAAKGGGDPAFNSQLRIAVEKAKSMNMPADNIERAIKKGTGELEGEKLEEVIYEAYGPGGIAIIIECITDNRNRSLNEIKTTLSKHNGKMVGEGGVKWMFERKGCIAVDTTQNLKTDNDEFELLAIESGAEDINKYEDGVDIYTRAEDLETVKQTLEEKGIKTSSTSLDWVAKEEIAVDEKTKNGCQKLFEVLDELDSVQKLYSNIHS